MKPEKYHDGREITQDEIETIWKIIQETNIEVDIEDGEIVLQVGSDNALETIGRCDLRRVAAHAAEIASEDAEIFALAGLFSKCAEIILAYVKPAHKQDEDSEGLGGAVRLFAGNEEKEEE